MLPGTNLLNSRARVPELLQSAKFLLISLFVSRPRKRGGHAESHIDRPGEVAFVLDKLLVAAEPVRGRTGGKRPRTIACPSHEGESHSQGKKLQPNVAACGIDKLRKEREEKDCRFRIDNINQNSLAEDFTHGDRW